MSEFKLAISKNAKILTLFAVGCTAMVGIVHLLTKDKIAKQAQQQLQRQLNSIIAPERHDNQIYSDCMLAATLANNTKIELIYRARLNEQPVAAAIKAVAPDGYNGAIELLIAVNTDGSVSGVRTLVHNETPGLGDKIELRKSNWINSFNGQKMLAENDSRWAVEKDGGMFDQFTGATITPRAVVKAVQQTVTYFNANQQHIFTTASNCGEQS